MSGRLDYTVLDDGCNTSRSVDDGPGRSEQEQGGRLRILQRRGVLLAPRRGMLQILTMVAVVCYAVNGALKAIQKQMDFFGALVIALVTAIGGGTVRDLLLRRPIFWVHDPAFLYAGACTAALVVLATRFARVPSRAVVVTDALGLALFAVIGAHVASATGVPRVPAILTGAMTGFGGGVVRDVLCGEMPGVLKQDIHATAAITGAATYVLLFGSTGDERLSLTSAVALVLVIRAVEVRWGLHLPTLRVGR